MTTAVDRFIRCKHCPSTTSSSPDAARMLGWRLFKGLSQTGKELDDVVCPGCAGTTTTIASPRWRSLRRLVRSGSTHTTSATRE